MDLLTLETDPRVTSRSSRNFGGALEIKEDKPMTQCWESFVAPQCSLRFALNFKDSRLQDS